MNDIESLIQEVHRSRMCTNLLLDSIDEADWFRQSSDRVTHVAWQVGHLAVGQYRMALLVIRSPLPSDEELISDSYIQRFQPGSSPDSVADHHLSVRDIRNVSQRVHEQTLAKWRQFRPESLSQSVSVGHAMCSTRGGAIG